MQPRSLQRVPSAFVATAVAVVLCATAIVTIPGPASVIGQNAPAERRITGIAPGFHVLVGAPQRDKQGDFLEIQLINGTDSPIVIDRKCEVFVRIIFFKDHKPVDTESSGEQRPSSDDKNLPRESDFVFLQPGESASRRMDFGKSFREFHATFATPTAEQSSIPVAMWWQPRNTPRRNFVDEVRVVVSDDGDVRGAVLSQIADARVRASLFTGHLETRRSL